MHARAAPSDSRRTHCGPTVRRGRSGRFDEHSLQNSEVIRNLERTNQTRYTWVDPLGTPGGGHLPLADRPVCLPTARVQLDVMCRRSATFPSRSGPDLRKAGRTRRRLGTAPNDAATLGTPTTRQHRQDVTAADTLFTQQPGRAHTARHAANRPRAKTKDGRSHHLQGRIDWTLTAAY